MEVTAGRVRKVDKRDWTAKKVIRGVGRGKNRCVMRTGGPREIG